MLKHLTPAHLIRRHIRQQEIATSRMRKSSERLGTNIDRQIIIMDLSGLSLSPNKTALDVFRATVDIDKAFSVFFDALARNLMCQFADILPRVP